MSAQLDGVYRSQRLRLVSIVGASAAAAWDAHYRDRARAVATIVPVVRAGQSQTVALVAGYMAAKAAAVGERVPTRGLDAKLYTTETLRGVPAEEVYARPFGALAGQLERGVEFAAAMTAARSSLVRLVGTDLQLTQTHAARDWMTSEGRVVGYRRVLGGGACPLCTEAASRTYRTEDLMPIHEHCSCGVEPLFGSEPVASVGTKVRVEDDPELGPRLVADSWSPTGPRLIEFEDAAA